MSPHPEPFRMKCGCLPATVELLDGQHPYKCPTNQITGGVDTAPFTVLTIAEIPLTWTRLHPVTVDPQPMHQVDGVPMPWGWMPHPADKSLGIPAAPRPIPDLDSRWCDLSEDGEGGFVARRWPELRIAAVVLAVDGDWSWRAFRVDTGTDLAAGKCGDLLAALDQVQAVIDQTVARLAEDVSKHLTDAN